jgi:hypothetical protein
MILLTVFMSHGNSVMVDYGIAGIPGNFLLTYTSTMVMVPIVSYIVSTKTAFQKSKVDHSPPSIAIMWNFTSVHL